MKAHPVMVRRWPGTRVLHAGAHGGWGAQHAEGRGREAVRRRRAHHAHRHGRPAVVHGGQTPLLRRRGGPRQRTSRKVLARVLVGGLLVLLLLGRGARLPGVIVHGRRALGLPVEAAHKGAALLLLLRGARPASRLRLPPAQ